MYKIVVSINGVGLRAVLYKKYWFIWLPDTIVQCANGGSITPNVMEWIRVFNIPKERLHSKHPIVLNYYDFV